MTAADLPRSGDELRLTRAASVQFINPITVRVIGLRPWSTYDGWLWIDAYELGDDGQAVERRDLYVRIDGIEILRRRPDLPRAAAAATVPRPAKSRRLNAGNHGAARRPAPKGAAGAGRRTGQPSDR